MRFVIVTGMSGAGKQTAMKMLEDMGFYCVDNLPVALIEKFVELILSQNTEYTKVALGLDVRVDQNFTLAQETLSRMKKAGYSYEMIFMDASDEVLLKRYKESRRMHPLANGAGVEAGIQKERETLKKIKKKTLFLITFINL